MSYDEKILSVRSVFETFNKSCPASDVIDVEKFLTKLKLAGGVTEEALSQCTWEDIEDCGDGKKIPRLLARQIAGIFRKETKVDSDEKKYISEKKAARMSAKELLENLNLQEEDSAVYKRVLAISKNLPFLVYRVDGSINIPNSQTCLADIQAGLEPPSMVIVDGIPHKVHRLTEKLPVLVPENPLYPGQTLRGIEETCDVTFRSWKEIDKKTRVILRLALQETRELRVEYPGQVHDILDLVRAMNVVNPGHAKSAESAVAQRYPRAFLLYQKLEKEGKLPTLQIDRNRIAAAKKQDPFHRG